MKLPKKFVESEWFKSRPEIIKKAYETWSPSDTFLIGNDVYYLLGFGETPTSEITNDPNDLMMLLSKINPFENYDLALKNTVRHCVKHFQKVTEH